MFIVLISALSLLSFSTGLTQTDLFTLPVENEFEELADLEFDSDEKEDQEEDNDDPDHDLGPIPTSAYGSKINDHTDFLQSFVSGSRSLKVPYFILYCCPLVYS